MSSNTCLHWWLHRRHDAALWTHDIGDSPCNADYGNAVQETDDGGFVVSGRIDISGYGVLPITPIKTDNNGYVIK